MKDLLNSLRNKVPQKKEIKLFEMKTNIIPGNEILEISEVLKDLPVVKVSFGCESAKVELVPFSPLRFNLEKKLTEQVDSITNVKVQSSIYKKEDRKLLKTVHVFYTIMNGDKESGTDDTLIKITIKTFCNISSIVDEFDKQLIKICSLYCRGIVSVNNVNDFLVNKLIVPINYEDMNLLDGKKFEGYINIYGESEEYLAAAIPETKQEDFFRYVEDSSDAEFYSGEFSDNLVLSDKCEEKEPENSMIINVVRRKDLIK